MNALIREQELSLSELGAVLESDIKQDYAVPAPRISVDLKDDNTTNIIFPAQDGIAIIEDMPLTDYARDQLHGRLSKGLKGVADTLRSNGLRSTYMNLMDDLLRADDRTFRVRTLTNNNLSGQTARAIVSDRYKPIDDDIIFGTALPLIDSDRFQGIGGNKTEIRTVAKFIEREPSVIIPSGDRTREFHLGFILHNSEVGCGSASFSMFMSDSFCFNGCIFSKEVLANISYRHIGSRIDIRHGLVSQEHQRGAELASIRRLIAEATQNAMSLNGMEKIKQTLLLSAQSHITRDVHDTITDVGKEMNITKDEVEEIPLYMNSDETTKLGLHSAITALAKDKPYERRLELEQIGGDVLMMPDRKWKALAVA
jgi:hypothetical protein